VGDSGCLRVRVGSLWGLSMGSWWGWLIKRRPGGVTSESSCRRLQVKFKSVIERGSALKRDEASFMQRGLRSYCGERVRCLLRHNCRVCCEADIVIVVCCQRNLTCSCCHCITQRITDWEPRQLDSLQTPTQQSPQCCLPSLRVFTACLCLLRLATHRSSP
jgi:hypothetical protein